MDNHRFTSLGLTLAGAATLFALTSPAARAQVVNGSFETGDFTGWARSGFFNSSAGGPTSGAPNFATFQAAQNAAPGKADTNAVVTAQTGAFDGNGNGSLPVGPTNGRYLAFLSNETSAGDSTLTGSSLTQSFTVPFGITFLSLDVRLLNNDDSGSFARFDDFGGVALLQGTSVFAQYNLDLAAGTSANAHVTAAAGAGGFVNSTPWQGVSFNVGALQGKTVTLTAYVTNYGGDNFTETRLLLDNVRTLAVPEPSATALLLAGAGLGGAALCRRHRFGPREQRA